MLNVVARLWAVIMCVYLAASPTRVYLNSLDWRNRNRVTIPSVCSRAIKKMQSRLIQHYCNTKKVKGTKLRGVIICFIYLFVGIVFKTRVTHHICGIWWYGLFIYLKCYKMIVKRIILFSLYNFIYVKC